MEVWYDKNLTIHIWPDIPQIEIFTKRGKSEVYQGESALVFSDWLREHLPVRKCANGVKAYD